MFQSGFEAGPRQETDPLLKETAKWQEMFEMVIPPDSPRAHEFQTITNKASLALLNLQIMRGRLDGADQVQRSNDELKKLYARATEIKAEEFSASLAARLGVTAGTSLDTTLLRETDIVKDLPGFQSIGLELEAIAKALSVDPSRVMRGLAAPGNLYFTAVNGGPAVLFEQVQKSRDFLAIVRRNLLPLQPSFAPLIDKLEAGLQHLDTVNPALTASNTWHTTMKNSKNKMDMMPVRVLTFLGGGFLAGLGLLHSIKEGEMPTWPTFAWGGLAALSAFPDILKDGATRSVQTLASLNNPLTQTLVALDFGKKAFAELQEVRRHPKKLIVLKQLVAGTTPVTNATIGMLTDQKMTALATVLLKLPKESARQALQMYGRAMPKGDQQLITSMLTGAPPPVS